MTNLDPILVPGQVCSSCANYFTRAGDDEPSCAEADFSVGHEVEGYYPPADFGCNRWLARGEDYVAKEPQVRSSREPALAALNQAMTEVYAKALQKQMDQVLWRVR
jgi:hypothetical protein